MALMFFSSRSGYDEKIIAERVGGELAPRLLGEGVGGEPVGGGRDRRQRRERGDLYGDQRLRQPERV